MLFNAIIAELIKLGYSPKYALLVAAQSAHETNGFKSRIFQKNNNLFGMRNPNKRPTTSKGDIKKNGYAYYTDYLQSIKDYTIYSQYFGYNVKGSPSVKAFVNRLKEKRYFEDTEENYRKGVQRWINYYIKHTQDERKN